MSETCAAAVPLSRSPDRKAPNLLPEARQLLRAADLLVARAEALKGGSTGTLRVAATPQVIAGVLAPFLPKQQRRHPAVEIQLVEGGAAEQPDRLASGEVQLAIMPSGDERFDGRLLYPVHACVVRPEKHRLGRRSVVDIVELADEPLLLLRREFGSRVRFQTACEIARLMRRIRLESAAPQTMVERAAAGYGIAVVPSTVVVRTAGVRVLPLVQNKASLGRWSMVAWVRERVLPAYARRFVAELVAHSRIAQPGKSFTRRAPPLPRPGWPVA